MSDSPTNPKLTASPITPKLIDYAAELFAQEDAELRALMQAAREYGIPNWEIAPDVGRLFQVLCRAISARRVIEFGTLAGYSALWIARALPSDGKLISLEYNPEYAAFARDQLRKTEAGSRVEIRLGTAIKLLPDLEREVNENGTPYDVVVLDADKIHYPEFFDWSTCVLRPGGLLIADNVLHSASWNGQSPDDPNANDPRVLGVREFNRRLAGDNRFTSIIIPMRDGVAAAVFHGNPA